MPVNPCDPLATPPTTARRGTLRAVILSYLPYFSTLVNSSKSITRVDSTYITTSTRINSTRTGTYSTHAIFTGRSTGGLLSDFALATWSLLQYIRDYTCTARMADRFPASPFGAGAAIAKTPNMVKKMY